MVCCTSFSFSRSRYDYDVFEELDDYNGEDFEEENSIQLCCTWGDDLADGILTYHIDYDSSHGEQDAVRDAIEEWDSKIDSLELETISDMKNSDPRNIIFDYST